MRDYATNPPAGKHRASTARPCRPPVPSVPVPRREAPGAARPRTPTGGVELALTDICVSWSDFCMRTTLSFDDHLFREAKELAARDGETLTQLVERAVAQYLNHRRARGRTSYRLELLVKEGRPTPGVNFDDRDSLYEWMEGRG